MKARRILPIVALILLASVLAVGILDNSTNIAQTKDGSISIMILSPQTGPFVDSSCTGTSNTGSSNSCAVTTSNPDLIIAELGTGSSGTTVSQISDTAGLTWTLYAHYVLSSSGSKSIFIYYAEASTPVTSDTVTATYSGSGNNGIVVVAVSNYNTATPFDPTSSPATSSSSTAVTNVGVSPVATANSNELVFGMFAIQSNPTVTPGTGFTGLSYSNKPTVYAEWGQLTSPETGLTVGATLSSAQVFLGVAFGIAPPPATTTSTSSTTSTTSTSTSTITSTSTSTTTTTSGSTTSTTTTATSTTTTLTTTSSTSSSTSTSLTVTASSSGNACFVNGYNAQIPVINAISWECAATLQGGQTIKQNIFRSSELYGPFSITVTASNSVTLVVYENGIQVFSQTGKSITWTAGTVTQNEPMYVTIGNSEASSKTTYQLAIDWTSV